jgi:hypothetical protein
VISRRVDVYFLRFVEIANTCVFLYVSWALGAHDMVGLRLQRSRLENGLNDFVPLLAAAPFLLAFVLLFRKELTSSQWLLIRAMHQALAIVTFRHCGDIAGGTARHSSRHYLRHGPRLAATGGP